MINLDKIQIEDKLKRFGVVEVLKIGHKFTMLIIACENSLDKLSTFNEINKTLTDLGVLDVYPNISVLKNEEDYFLLMLEK